ncbi:hypothetical protein ES708_14558 [subsurface metagenome]
MIDEKNRMFNTKRPDKNVEMAAVRTTIVGGRPPGSGKNLPSIPRGIEVLVKKASVDRDFRELLLRKRDQAAEEIGLELDQLEKNILRSVPEEQLKAIINSVKVSKKHRMAFLGKVAAVMLAALGVVALAGCGDEPVPVIEGERPDRPVPKERNVNEDQDKTSGDGSSGSGEKARPYSPATDGIRPDRPPQKAPEEEKEADEEVEKKIPNSRGISPDHPPQKR